MNKRANPNYFSIVWMMIRSIVLLAFYLHSIAGQIISKPSSHYSDALKIKCDALPYRTVYFDRNCYFIIDADADVSTSTKRCSSALSNAKVAQPGKVPDEVWSWLFVDENLFISDAEEKGKTKAMCIFENRFLSSTASAPRTTINQGLNLTARVMGATTKFPDEIEVGQTMIVKGYFTPQAPDLISFNLQTNHTAAIAPHFLFDFRGSVACMHTLRAWGGVWDPADGCAPQPFRRGQPFDFRVRFHQDHFQIFTNGKEFGVYKYRLPLSSINYLAFGGGPDMIATYIQMGEKYAPAFPNGFEKGFPVCGKQSKCSANKQYASNMTRADCKPLIITGRFIPYLAYAGGVPGRFYINLKRKNGDYALHFGTRFAQPFDHVVLNTWMATHWGGWQTEVQINKLPFKSGEKFKIAIINDVHGFQIFVDGVYFTTFEHRMCPYDIAEVEVSPHVFDLGLKI